MKSYYLIKALFDFPPEAWITGDEAGDIEVFEHSRGRLIAVIHGMAGNGIEITYHYGCEQKTCGEHISDIDTPSYRRINRTCRRNAGHPGKCTDEARP